MAADPAPARPWRTGVQRLTGLEWAQLAAPLIRVPAECSRRQRADDSGQPPVEHLEFAQPPECAHHGRHDGTENIIDSIVPIVATRTHRNDHEGAKRIGHPFDTPVVDGRADLGPDLLTLPVIFTTTERLDDCMRSQQRAARRVRLIVAGAACHHPASPRRVHLR